MNNEEIRTFLLKLGLKIENWLRFSSFLTIFPFDKILKNFIHFFIDKKTNLFYKNTTDNDVIDLILFDKKIGLTILRWFLFFEIKFKKIIVEKWFSFHPLHINYLYQLDENDFLKYLPNLKNCSDLNLKKFRYSLFEHVSNSEFLQEYQNLQDIPLMDLITYWTFATTINFFRVMNSQIKINVLKELNIPYNMVDSFHKILNVLLKVRNTISHNHILYNFHSNLYRIEFNQLYKILFKENYIVTKAINIYKIITLIDYFLNWNYCKKNFDEHLKNLKINAIAKEKLIKLFFGID